MNLRTAGTIILFVALLGAAEGLGIAKTSDPSPEGTKRALLIGINRYKNLPSLNGSINDVQTMRRVLTTQWGFPADHVTMLTDDAATRAGMLAAFERFVKEVGPQDTVYIHYSGHGSQVADLNGDETDDQLDETLVPHDGRSGSVPDITDDELDEIFSRLKARTALIVLDSCHSGTATRSPDIRTRSVPQDMRVDLYRKPGVTTRHVTPLISSRYILMTGAAANQEALDGPVEGRYHGFFSYSLSKSLGSSGPSSTPRDIFSGIERELKRIQTHFGRASMPEPQLEAPADLLDKPFFTPSVNLPEHATTVRGRLPWIDVRPLDGDTVELKQGPLLGALPGSLWALYPPGETTFTPGKALAVASVTQVHGTDSWAKLQTTAGPIPAGARAVAFLPAPAPRRVPVRILDTSAARRAQIVNALTRYAPDVDIVGPDGPARFLIDIKDNAIQLYSADGLQRVGSFPMDREQWGAGLGNIVSRSGKVSDVLTLENPTSQLQLDVKVANAPRMAHRGVTVVADTQPAHYRIRQGGEPRTPENSLQLEVHVNVDSYLTVVDIDSQGNVTLLFPNTYQQAAFYPEGRVRAGDAVALPDSLQGRNHAGFYWDYTPPTGTDTIRVFATTDVSTAQVIRQQVQVLSTQASPSQDGVTTRAAVSNGVELLRGDLTRRATRGFSPVYDPTPPSLTSGTQPPVPPPATPPSKPAPPVIAADPLPATSIAQPANSLNAASASDWTASTVTILVE